MDKIIRRSRWVLLFLLWSWFVLWYGIKAERKGQDHRSATQQMVVSARDSIKTAQLFFQKATSGLSHREKVFPRDATPSLIGSFSDDARIPDNLMILHYRYQGGSKGSVLLQNVKTGEIQKEWSIDLVGMRNDLIDVSERFRKHRVEKNIKRFRIGHENLPDFDALQVRSPYMTSEMNLLYNCGLEGPTYCIDSNSDLVWKNDQPAHHSLELDAEGNIWTCSVELDNKFANRLDYRDDAVLCISRQGKTVSKFSLTEIFESSGLMSEYLQDQSVIEQDPFHLNDVQPVDFDGPYWKKGDVFLSLRHCNLVALFRPEDGTVPWHQFGPWKGQHDVRVVSENQISIFNNKWYPLSGNAKGNIADYDFETQQTSFHAEDIFFSFSNGRHVGVREDLLIIEAFQEATYYMVSPDGEVLGAFYNPHYSDESNAQYPCWARFYLQTEDGYQALD